MDPDGAGPRGRDALLRKVEEHAQKIWPSDRPRDTAITLLAITIGLRIAEVSETPAGLLMLGAGVKKAIGEIAAAEWERTHG